MRSVFGKPGWFSGMRFRFVIGRWTGDGHLSISHWLRCSTVVIVATESGARLPLPYQPALCSYGAVGPYSLPYADYQHHESPPRLQPFP